MSDRVRILFYNHTGLTSGAERVLLNTLAGLDRRQFDPVVVCPSDGDLMALVDAAGIPTVAAKTLHARFTLHPGRLINHLSSFVRLIRSFRKAVRDIAPDAIHANSIRAGIVATLATIGCRTPVVWHVHDDLPRHPISSGIRLIAFFSRRTRFLAVSQATAAVFRGKFPFGDRVRVLYNGIDLDRYPAKTGTASSLREDLGLKQGELLISAVGMINPRKGLTGLLEAFEHVYGSLPHVHLAIVGAPIFNRDDLYLQALLEQSTLLGVSDRVHFTGRRTDVAAVLRTSDLLVLNALVEPFGLVLVEAISSGTPVLATRVGGIPEIITDNQTGFLVPPSSPSALAARLIEVLGDPEALTRVSTAARLQVSPLFSQTRYNSDFAEYYRTVTCNSEIVEVGEPHLNLK